MKKILSSLLALSATIFAHCQVINLSPATLSFSTPIGSTFAPQSVTISASGLVPASGNIVVTAPLKYGLSYGGSLYNNVCNIAYSGGTLPPTTLNVAVVSTTGIPEQISISVSGGGASANVCVCNDNPSCSCAPAFVAATSGERSITVLPNPVVNELVITATTKITAIAISNLIGNTVYTHRFNSENVRVDVADLPGGIYLVRINDTEVRRFVKQ